ncbi:unnamed protein product [Peronospora destructor]|uniref:RxLR effector protein n=1 Tax=Peronospora destructor TaxID=86335 RepID=A0AAV0TZA7_9STRA|nr:unnamed protein product [Peronospora destructor]
MRLPLLLLMSTALISLADCSARSTDTSSSQRLRQSVDAVDVRSEGNVKGQKFQRLLTAKSAEEEEDDEVSKDERSGVVPRGEITALSQGEGMLHAAETSAGIEVNALSEWFAKADRKFLLNRNIESIKDLKNLKTSDELNTLKDWYAKWSEAGIEPKMVMDALFKHEHKGARFITVMNGYLKYSRQKAAEDIAKAAAGAH